MRLSLLACPLVACSLLAGASLTACGGDDTTSSSGGEQGTSGGEGGGGGGGGSALPTAPKTGVATFYDYSGSKEVACSFDVSADTNVTAINDGEYAKAASCGSCLNVIGPKGSIKVRVVDRCPGCEQNHLDLSAQAFAKIAEPKAGRAPITYEVVACDVPDKMSYRFKEGSSKFWTAIQVREHRLPITKVEYLKDGSYVAMPRSDYNYFIDTKGVGDQPNGLSLRVTASDGQVVDDSVPAVQAGKVFTGTKQFN